MENDNNQDSKMEMVIAHQYTQLEEIQQKLNKIIEGEKKFFDNPNNNPMPLDFRRIDAFFTLQQEYFNIFAKNNIGLEFVPFSIIQSSNKWATKNFKKDLRRQVNRMYRELRWKEFTERIRNKTKAGINELLERTLWPFKQLKKRVAELIKRLKEKRTKTKAEKQAKKKQQTSTDQASNENLEENKKEILGE